VGTNHDTRFLIGLLVISLAVTALSVIGLLMVVFKADPNPLPTITVPLQVMATATLEPRLPPAVDSEPPRHGVVVVESQSSKTITAQEIIAITTPQVLEIELVPVTK
jgi:hypothetical protein